MAGGESATAFLETNLGTRLAVSFPADSTTVADLKRKVIAEHAASFPHMGRITVESFKVRRRGSLYHLTDSMAVQAAFHGFKGAWYLQVDARKDIDMQHFIGGCTETQDNPPLLPHDAASQRVIASADAAAVLRKCSSNVGSQVQCRENSDLDAAADKDGVPLGIQGQQIGIIFKEKREKKRSGVEDENRASNRDGGVASFVSSRLDDMNKSKNLTKDKCADPNSNSERICGREGDFFGEIDVDSVFRGDADGSNEKFKDQAALGLSSLGNGEEPKLTRSAGEVESNSESPALRFIANKNDSIAVTEKDTNQGIPHAKLVDQQDHLNNGAEEESNLLKDRNTISQKACAPVLQKCTSAIHSESLADCHSEGSSWDFDFTRCKKSKCEVLTDQVRSLGETPSCDRKEPFTVEPEGAEFPPFVEPMKGGNPSEKEVMARKGKEKEPCTAGVFNGESSNKGTDLPPCFESTKRDNSPEKQLMVHECEIPKADKVTYTHKDGTTERTETADSLLSDQWESSATEAKGYLWDLESPCENAEKWSDGTVGSENNTIQLNDLTKEKSGVARHGSSDNYLNKGKYKGARSTDSTEQELCCHRRQRVAVRKLPMSRITKNFGFR